MSYNWFQTKVHKDWSPCILTDKALGDRVHDTLPQNLAPWVMAYFKLKEFENWQVQGLCDSPAAGQKTLT